MNKINLNVAVDASKEVGMKDQLLTALKQLLINEVDAAKTPEDVNKACERISLFNKFYKGTELKVVLKVHLEMDEEYDEEWAKEVVKVIKEEDNDNELEVDYEIIKE